MLYKVENSSLKQPRLIFVGHLINFRCNICSFAWSLSEVVVAPAATRWDRCSVREPPSRRSADRAVFGDMLESIAAVIESTGIQASHRNLSNDIRNIITTIIIAYIAHTHLRSLACFVSGWYTQNPFGCQIIISAIIKQTDQHHPQGWDHISWLLPPPNSPYLGITTLLLCFCSWSFFVFFLYPVFVILWFKMKHLKFVLFFLTSKLKRKPSLIPLTFRLCCFFHLVFSRLLWNPNNQARSEHFELFHTQLVFLGLFLSLPPYSAFCSLNSMFSSARAFPSLLIYFQSGSPPPPFLSLSF